MKLFKSLRKNPPLILGLSFAVLILLGALLLTLPLASADGHSVGFIDALFTASSASCVTGLTVRNTQETWSAFGKIVILLCIQIGGLGTMSLVTILSLLLRKRIGLRDRMVIKEQLNTDTLKGMVRMIKIVVLFTLAVEGMGALLLSIRLIPLYGFKTGVIYSIFHSISAFCNAGFDLFGDSLRPYAGDLILNLVIMFLIIFGGLGFQVYVDLWRRKTYKSLSAHSKMVIEATIFLLLAGTLIFAFFEWTNPLTLGHMPLGEKILASGFQSTISRTAGFYSVPMESMKDSTSLFMILLMFIGGSPGSTAGGLKTTTCMVLVLTVLSSIRGKEDVVWHERTIESQTVKMAFVMFFICLCVVFTVTSCLVILEPGKSVLRLLFETVSAFGTVGVTQNVTGSIQPLSKLILSLTMFLGRVGPTTLALGLGKNMHTKRKIHYAGSKIFIG